jgi:hypothetical protein
VKKSAPGQSLGAQRQQQARRDEPAGPPSLKPQALNWQGEKVMAVEPSQTPLAPDRCKGEVTSPQKGGSLSVRQSKCGRVRVQRQLTWLSWRKKIELQILY